MPFVVDFLVHRLSIHRSALFYIRIDGSSSPLVVRIFCRTIVHVLCRIALGIHEAEIEFLFRIVCKRRHGFLQSPQLDEDGSGKRSILCSILARTDRRALDNIYLGGLGVDAEIIEGIVGTGSRFTHVIYHQFEVGEIIHTALLLQHHLSVNLIPFSYIGSIFAITVSRKITG